MSLLSFLFSRSFFVPLFFLFSHSSFDLRLLITPLVSSNFSEVTSSSNSSENEIICLKLRLTISLKVDELHFAILVTCISTTKWCINRSQKSFSIDINQWQYSSLLVTNSNENSVILNILFIPITSLLKIHLRSI